jgi:hypothetical protein
LPDCPAEPRNHVQIFSSAAFRIRIDFNQGAVSC